VALAWAIAFALWRCFAWGHLMGLGASGRPIGHALEQNGNNSHMPKVGGQMATIQESRCPEAPAGLLNAAVMRRASSRSFGVAGRFRLPEWIVRPGPPNKPGALRWGGQHRMKNAGSGEPIPSSGLYGAGHSPEGRKQIELSAGWHPVPGRSVGAPQKAPGGRCRDNASRRATRAAKGDRLRGAPALPLARGFRVPQPSP
jgi:hypothetical protein